MTCARTILALVSALALAVLPAAGRAAVNANHATEMTAAQPVADGCPQDANEGDQAAPECWCMAVCPLHCFSFAVGQSSPLFIPRVSEASFRYWRTLVSAHRRVIPRSDLLAPDTVRQKMSPGVSFGSRQSSALGPRSDA